MSIFAKKRFVPRNITLRILPVLLLAAGAQAQFLQQGNKLVASDAIGLANQGVAVAISADGNTAIFGGYNDNNGVGAAWVYTRTSGVWSEQAKLTASDAVGLAGFGNSVALSADGNTAFISGPWDNNNTGASWVFVRSGATWTEQSKLLAQPEAASTCSACHGNSVTAAQYNAQYQGTSVSLSADGNTAVVGGAWDHFNRGAAWIYTRSGTVWSQASGTLLASDAAGASYQGAAVALSGDGATAMVGGTGQDKGKGAIWAYVLSSGNWSQQGTKLQPSDAVGAEDFGVSAALSTDGNTVLVGGDHDAGFLGAAWVFTRAAGVWTQQGSKLTGTDSTGVGQPYPYIYEGFAVSISADGNTAAVGGWGDGADLGAVWEYTRFNGVWTQRGDKIVGTGAVGAAEQGSAVAISGDGATLISGGFLDNSNAGAVWVFTYAAPPLVQQGSKITGSGSPGEYLPQYGLSVAVSADGNTFAATTENSNNAYIYGRSNGTWTQQTVITGGGWSVALSADGNTAVAGVSGAGNVYTRASGVWTLQAQLVGTGAVSGVNGLNMGRAVAISGDGNTAFVSAPYDSNLGAVWAFTRNGATWTQQGNKLQATGGSNPYPCYETQGISLAASADGNTLLVGDTGNAGCTGTAWVFSRDANGNWTQQAQLLPSGAQPNSNLEYGFAVALAADGNTAIVGGWYSYNGGATPFVRSNGVWSQQGGKLAVTGGIGSFLGVGAGAALSSDGNTVLLGAPMDDGQIGAMWMMTRTGGVWSQLGSKMVGTGYTQIYSSGSYTPVFEGGAVALSGDAHTAIMGGYRDSKDTGAVWVFSAWPAPASLKVTAPASAAPGAGFGFGVTAVSSNGIPVGNYNGTVHFTSSDGAAGLPSDAPLSYGAGTFTATLNTLGAQTITATDSNASLTGTSNSIAVTAAGVATNLIVSAPATATSGASFSFTVTAVDAAGNTVTGYAHTVHFTSTDSAAGLPSDAALVNGTGTFTATLKTLGRQFLTATDTSASTISGKSPEITVSAALAATHFVVSAASFVRGGVAFNFTVTATDATGNTAPGYTGTVHFTSSDSQATLPPNATLTSGVGTFPATLKTVGGQTITATDTVSSLTGVSGTITVCSMCDINLDGAMNVVDVQLEINEALGVTPAANDLNGDGQVNVVDVQIVINAALGLGCAAS